MKSTFTWRIVGSLLTGFSGWERFSNPGCERFTGFSCLDSGWRGSDSTPESTRLGRPILGGTWFSVEPFSIRWKILFYPGIPENLSHPSSPASSSSRWSRANWNIAQSIRQSWISYVGRKSSGSPSTAGHFASNLNLNTLFKGKIKFISIVLSAEILEIVTKVISF